MRILLILICVVLVAVLVESGNQKSNVPRPKPTLSPRAIFKKTYGNAVRRITLPDGRRLKIYQSKPRTDLIEMTKDDREEAIAILATEKFSRDIQTAAGVKRKDNLGATRGGGAKFRHDKQGITADRIYSNYQTQENGGGRNGPSSSSLVLVDQDAEKIPGVVPDLLKESLESGMQMIGRVTSSPDSSIESEIAVDGKENQKPKQKEKKRKQRNQQRSG